MSLLSDVADYVPPFLAEKRKKRFEQIQARMKADAEALVRMELISCREILKSRQKLREIDDLTTLGNRVRFLARILSEEVLDVEFTPYYQEQKTRNARATAKDALRRLRKAIEMEKVHLSWFKPAYRNLKKSMSQGGLSLESLGITQAEMDQFKNLSGIA